MKARLKAIAWATLAFAWSCVKGGFAFFLGFVLTAGIIGVVAREALDFNIWTPEQVAHFIEWWRFAPYVVGGVFLGATDD